jgi:hypothetical protein
VAPNDFNLDIPGEDEGRLQGASIFNELTRSRSEVFEDLTGESQQEGIESLRSSVDALDELIQSVNKGFDSMEAAIERSAKAMERVADPAERTARASKASASARKEEEKSTFRIRDVLTKLAHGNLTGAAGELFQQFPVAAKLGAAGQERLASGQGFRGLGMMGAARLLSPATIVGVEEAWRRGIGAYQGAMTQGQQAGLQGTDAARDTLAGRAFGFHQALNPFDALSFRAAQAIAKGVQSEGFSGQMREAWQETVGNLVKETGMSAQDALAAMSTGINELGQTVGQFKAGMADVQDVAHDTDMSVSQVVKTFQGLQKVGLQLGGTGGAQTFGRFAETLSRAFVGTTAMKRGIGERIAGGIAGAAPIILGISPFEVGNLTDVQLAQYEDILAARMWEIKNGSAAFRNMRVEDFAIQALPLIQGMAPGLDQLQVQDIIDIMKTGIKHGGHGFTAHARALEQQRKIRQRKINLPTPQPRHGGILTSEGRKELLLGKDRHKASLTGTPSLGLDREIWDALPEGVKGYLRDVGEGAVSAPVESAKTVFGGIKHAIFGSKDAETEEQKRQERQGINELMAQIRQTTNLTPDQRQRIRNRLSKEIGDSEALRKAKETLQIDPTTGRTLSEPGTGAPRQNVDITIGFKQPALNDLLTVSTNPDARSKKWQASHGRTGTQNTR